MWLFYCTNYTEIYQYYPIRVTLIECVRAMLDTALEFLIRAEETNLLSFEQFVKLKTPNLFRRGVRANSYITGLLVRFINVRIHWQIERSRALNLTRNLST